jgi:outer membrane protein OmpA-like peptidoglycan-associated protein
MKYFYILIVFFYSAFSFSQSNQTKETVYFDNDSYSLSQQSKTYLLSKIDIFNQTELDILGYTDVNGDETYNLKLSQKRAEAVNNFLIKNGVDKNHIKSVKGLGESTTYSTLKENRRVNIITKENVNNKSDLIVEKTIDTALVTKTNITKTATQPSSNNLNNITDLQVGQTLLLENFQFYPGRHIPLKNSEKILKKLVEILEQNPTLKIEIQGHICCQPSGTDGIDNDTGEWGLSINRAKYVYDYLIQKGINPSRLSYKGFGASKPLVEEINSEAMQMNRRVEIMVVEK